jgi:hypothetical protein
MGLARFELASRSPEPRRMDQATPQSQAGAGDPTPLFERAGRDTHAVLREGVSGPLARGIHPRVAISKGGS